MIYAYAYYKQGSTQQTKTREEHKIIWWNDEMCIYINNGLVE